MVDGVARTCRICRWFNVLLFSQLVCWSQLLLLPNKSTLSDVVSLEMPRIILWKGGVCILKPDIVKVVTEAQDRSSTLNSVSSLLTFHLDNGSPPNLVILPKMAVTNVSIIVGKEGIFIRWLFSGRWQLSWYCWFRCCCCFCGHHSLCRCCWTRCVFVAFWFCSLPISFLSKATALSVSVTSPLVKTCWNWSHHCNSCKR